MAMNFDMTTIMWTKTSHYAQVPFAQSDPQEHSSVPRFFIDRWIG